MEIDLGLVFNKTIYHFVSGQGEKVWTNSDVTEEKLGEVVGVHDFMDVLESNVENTTSSNSSTKDNQDQNLTLSKNQRSKIGQNPNKTLQIRDRITKPKMCGIRFQTQHIPAFKALAKKPQIQAFSCPPKKSSTTAPDEKSLEDLLEENETKWYSNPTYNTSGQNSGQNGKKVNAQGKCNIFIIFSQNL